MFSTHETWWQFVQHYCRGYTKNTAVFDQLHKDTLGLVICSTCEKEGFDDTEDLILHLFWLVVTIYLFYFLLICYRFPKETVHCLETSQDAVTLLRLLANQKRKRHVQCCEQRPHLLVEGLEHIPNDDNDVCWCLCCVCVCLCLCVCMCT